VTILEENGLFPIKEEFQVIVKIAKEKAIYLEQK